jgi:predicted Fe-S protein YdhL (DUF1289 family)
MSGKADPVSFVPPITVESPCVGVCALDQARQYCTGCGRTIVEIGRWTSGSDAWRAQIIADLPRRLAARAPR